MSDRLFRVLIGAVSLASGGLIYIIFRSNTYIAVLFNEFNCIKKIREVAGVFSCDFVKYYFPDFLWCFSLCFFMQAVIDITKKGVVLSGIASVLCGVLWEVFQYIGTVSGTGDLSDIIMYLTAGVTAVALGMLMQQRK